MLGSGAGEGVSKLMTGGGLTGSLGITASSSSSSELSKVRSITGPLVSAGLAAAGVAAVVITDNDKRFHFLNKVCRTFE